MANQEQTKRRGRPGIYSSAAERARAWRQRQKDMIAQAQQPVEPLVIEKVVEKIIEKVVEVPAVERSKPARAGKRIAPQASTLFAALQDSFGNYGGEERAKRLRVNAAKVASTAREILRMLDRKANVPDTEQAFLRDVAEFFEEMNGLFHGAQGKAKFTHAKALAESNAKREAQISEAIRLTFGETLNLTEIRATAEALRVYASNKELDAEAKRKGVDRVDFFINRPTELKAALTSNDASQIAREVAEIRLEAGERGYAWNNRDKPCYRAGWEDFAIFRTNGN